MDETSYDQELLSWTFPEFDARPRPNVWYLWFGIGAALLIFYGVFTDNFLFAVIIILAALILFLRNWRKPADIRFVVKPTGITVASRVYPMKDIKEFWIAYKPPYVESLYLEFNSVVRPNVAIPLQGNDPLQVRKVLLEYLPENLEKDDEPFADSLARLLRL